MCAPYLSSRWPYATPFVEINQSSLKRTTRRTLSFMRNYRNTKAPHLDDVRLVVPYRMIDECASFVEVVPCARLDSSTCPLSPCLRVYWLFGPSPLWLHFRMKRRSIQGIQVHDFKGIDNRGLKTVLSQINTLCCGPRAINQGEPLPTSFIDCEAGRMLIGRGLESPPICNAVVIF